MQLSNIFVHIHKLKVFIKVFINLNIEESSNVP